MTRDEGIDLVTRYDDSCSPEYIAAFCDYIGITVDAFWKQVHASVNRDLFDIRPNGLIERKYTVGAGL